MASVTKKSLRPAFLGYRPFDELPRGVNFDGHPHPADHVHFLKDLTWHDGDGVLRLSHNIFDEMLQMVRDARRLICLDMFLFNELLIFNQPVRSMGRELTDALIRQRQQHPALQIVFITDPCNTLYGSLPSQLQADLVQAGIDVVTTDLDQLRDSSPVYSFLWRLLLRPLGNSPRGWLPNPFSDQRVSLRGLLHIPNMKANHRKTMVADSEVWGWVGLVSTANPHDASWQNRNVALKFNGPAVLELLQTEMAVLEMAGVPLPDIPCDRETVVAEPHDRISIHTEGAIRDQVLRLIERAQPGDRIDFILFYLSERNVVRALISAAKRGVSIRVVLDPAKDAFGFKKIGIPNRPVASQIVAAGIDVRWADTHGEQCHSKMALLHFKGTNETALLLGSANYTRRNLANFNLETDVLLLASPEDACLRDASDTFEDIWHNHDGRIYTVDYAMYEERSFLRHALYWVMEVTGISTF